MQIRLPEASPELPLISSALRRFWEGSWKLIERSERPTLWTLESIGGLRPKGAAGGGHEVERHEVQALGGFLFDSRVVPEVSWVSFLVR